MNEPPGARARVALTGLTIAEVRLVLQCWWKQRLYPSRAANDTDDPITCAAEKPQGRVDRSVIELERSCRSLDGFWSVRTLHKALLRLRLWDNAQMAL